MLVTCLFVCSFVRLQENSYSYHYKLSKQAANASEILPVNLELNWNKTKISGPKNLVIKICTLCVDLYMPQQYSIGGSTMHWVQIFYYNYGQSKLGNVCCTLHY